MKRQLTPSQAAVAWGVPVGLVVALIALLSGVYRVEGTLPGVLDAALAFVLGAALAGVIAGFVQWRRIVAGLGDVAPPGWYDAPDEDGTQWFWTGTRWSDRTRATPPRTQTRRI